MIIWSEKVQYSSNIRKRRRKKLQQQINDGEITRDFFCIALPSNPKNLLDIYSTGELKYPYYKRHEVKVIGIAKGKDKAEELVCDMLEELYASTGGFDTSKFFN